MAQRAPLHDPGQHGGGYARHRPEETVLYRTIEAHWPAFRERAEEAGGLPRFVVREVEEYLRCGILEHGCVRVGCARCGFERLVAFSCKRRGFCPSCLGRRMADTAIHLVEKVIPEVPVRQWVCSLPWRCLGLESVAQALTGAVSVIQRGDSSLRLNVHFHVISLDGVYVREKPDAPLVFHPLPAPTPEEVADVASRTALRVQKILERHGRSLDGTGDRDGDDAQPAEQLALCACYGAAASGLGLEGERAGQPLLRIVAPGLARDAEPVAQIMGFNVHAQVAIPARDRAKLERLCRYVCRPPIAQDRLEEHPSGKLRLALKKPWRDGTVALVLEPLDLIARVCALVPPPRLHMVRYHGVLSSHARVRSEIVPQPDAGISPTRVVQLELFGDNESSGDNNNEPRRKPWAWLLRHVFAIDMSTCPHCAGPMRWLEAATTPDAIARLLAKHGLGPRPPPKNRATNGQLRLAFPKA